MTIDYPRVYLAGPEIYFPQAKDIDARGKSICDRFGMEGISTFDNSSFGSFAGIKNDTLKKISRKYNTYNIRRRPNCNPEFLSRTPR